MRTMPTKLLLLLLGLLLAEAPRAWAQVACTPNPDPTTGFAVYRVGGTVPVSELCVGNPYRLKDTSGRSIPPALIRYAKLAALTCNPADTDTSTFYTPGAAGTVVITQNTPSADPAKLGVIFGRAFTVRALPDPTFTVTACTPGVVQVTITDASYDQYFVQVGSGPAQPAPRNTPTAYPTNGATSVKVTGLYLNGCSRDLTKTFTPKPAAVTPFIQRLDALGGSFTFQFGPLQPEYVYSLQQADNTAPGGYRTVATGLRQPSYVLLAAPAAGCFRLLLLDDCQPAITNLPSAELCAVALTGTSANGRNTLTWAPNGASGYVLRRDGVVLPGAASPYVDSVGVTCGVTYRYRLEATTGSGTTAGVSTSEVNVPTSALQNQPVPRLFATFNTRNQVELTATVPNLPSGGQLLYLRDNSQILATARRVVRDSAGAVLARPVCYAAQFADACGNKSAASAAFCPVFLTAKAADDDGTRAQLTWSALGSPAPAAAVRYTVEVQLTDGSWRAASAALNTLDFLDLQPPTDRQVLRYRVAASAPGQPVSYSNVSTVARQLKVFLPTAFTPNGDGLNDVLEVKGRFLTTFKFTVVDRNGQEVFRGTDRTQTWNGRIGNEPPALGPYVWRFEATDETGLRVVQHGTITILR